MEKETCGRCNGVGGWAGWPGFTCYRCRGSGMVALKKIKKVATPILQPILPISCHVGGLNFSLLAAIATATKPGTTKAILIDGVVHSYSNGAIVSSRYVYGR